MPLCNEDDECTPNKLTAKGQQLTAILSHRAQLFILSLKLFQNQLLTLFVITYKR